MRGSYQWHRISPGCNKSPSSLATGQSKISGTSTEKGKMNESLVNTAVQQDADSLNKSTDNHPYGNVLTYLIDRAHACDWTYVISDCYECRLGQVALTDVLPLLLAHHVTKTTSRNNINNSTFQSRIPKMSTKPYNILSKVAIKKMPTPTEHW